MKKTKLAAKLIAVLVLSITSCSQELTRDEVENKITKTQKKEISSRISNSSIEQSIFELLDKTVNIGNEISGLIPDGVNESITNEIYSSKSEEELRNILSKYSITNPQEFINLLNEQALLNKEFHEVNVEFYNNYSEDERNEIITQVINNYFIEDTTATNKLGCYDTYLRDLKRANRNYVTCMAGAWATAVFTEGIGGVIVAGGCIAIKHFQDADAVEDYQNCIHP